MYADVYFTVEAELDRIFACKERNKFLFAFKICGKHVMKKNGGAMS